MLATQRRAGLIVTTGQRRTAPLDVLIALGDWPLLLQANARSVLRQVEVCQPACLLFWLESLQDAAATEPLIVQLRQRGPRPTRIVIAYRLPTEIETRFRAAGAHAFLPIFDNPVPTVQTLLRPWLETVEGAEAPVHAASGPGMRMSAVAQPP